MTEEECLIGLLDRFRSSYNLGDQFTNTELHTRDLSCSMDDYWLSPDGVLWKPDYTGVNKLVFYEEDHPYYDPEALWSNYDLIPTGNNGRVRRQYTSSQVRIYPPTWNGEWNDWPTLRLLFENGILKDWEDITGYRKKYNLEVV